MSARRPAWQHLFDRMLEDALSVEEAADLERLLATDDEALRDYVALMNLHTGLDWRMNLPGETLAERAAEPDVSAARTRRGFWPSFNTTWAALVNRPGVFSIVLATVMLVMGLGVLSFIRISQLGDYSDPPTLGAPPVFVARITRTDASRWDESDPIPVGYGSHLFAGQRIRLLAGAVEVTWRSGTRAILQGPADLVVASENLLHLNEQPTSISICDGVSGFVLRTESLEIVDLGTEFSVQQESGFVAVHVFRGAVRVQPRQTASDESQRLEAGEAARYETRSGQLIARFQAQAERFVRHVGPAPMPRAKPRDARASTFDHDAEGWTVSFDSAPLRYLPDAGKPGGCVLAYDQSLLDVDQQASYYYFVAPSHMLGDRADLLGKTLSYDLLVQFRNGRSAISADKQVDLVLVGGGRQLGLKLSTLPVQGEWTMLAAKLSADAGWFWLDDPAVAATDDDLLAALSDLRELRIRGEYLTGPDTTCLDNVFFGEEE